MFGFKGVNHNFGECRRMRPGVEEKGQWFGIRDCLVVIHRYCVLSFYTKGYPDLEARFLSVQTVERGTKHCDPPNRAEQ